MYLHFSLFPHKLYVKEKKQALHEIIPLPFFPESLQKIMELLPFASMQNVALRIYSGSMDNAHIQKAIILQLAWLVVITLTGKILCYLAEKKITIQGG